MFIQGKWSFSDGSKELDLHHESDTNLDHGGFCIIVVQHETKMQKLVRQKEKWCSQDCQCDDHHADFSFLSILSTMQASTKDDEAENIQHSLLDT